MIFISAVTADFSFLFFSIKSVNADPVLPDHALVPVHVEPDTFALMKSSSAPIFLNV